jgi:hypothetical protein
MNRSLHTLLAALHVRTASCVVINRLMNGFSLDTAASDPAAEDGQSFLAMTGLTQIRVSLDEALALIRCGARDDLGLAQAH